MREQLEANIQKLLQVQAAFKNSNQIMGSFWGRSATLSKPTANPTLFSNLPDSLETLATDVQSYTTYLDSLLGELENIGKALNAVKANLNENSLSDLMCHLKINGNEEENIDSNLPQQMKEAMDFTKNTFDAINEVLDDTNLLIETIEKGEPEPYSDNSNSMDYTS